MSPTYERIVPQSTGIFRMGCGALPTLLGPEDDEWIDLRGPGGEVERAESRGDDQPRRRGPRPPVPPRDRESTRLHSPPPVQSHSLFRLKTQTDSYDCVP